MRTDVKTEPRRVTIEACRQLHPLGSTHAIFLLDEESHYAGTVLLADLFSSDFDVGADTREVSELAKYRDMTLTPPMNIKVVMACFDKAESEILAVRDETTHQVLGFLTEALARKRYVDEIDRATEEVFQ